MVETMLTNVKYTDSPSIYLAPLSKLWDRFGIGLIWYISEKKVYPEL